MEERSAWTVGQAMYAPSPVKHFPSFSRTVPYIFSSYDGTAARVVLMLWDWATLHLRTKDVIPIVHLNFYPFNWRIVLGYWRFWDGFKGISNLWLKTRFFPFPFPSQKMNPNSFPLYIFLLSLVLKGVFFFWEIRNFKGEIWQRVLVFRVFFLIFVS